MKRADVFMAHLAPRSGSEQTGHRPVIIVSHNNFNTAPRWRSIIVVPVTTSVSQSKQSPTILHLPAGAGGLTHDSIALCHQITTIDRSKLGKHLGQLDEQQMAELEEAIKAALDME
jgi:mRNA interferase MazF